MGTEREPQGPRSEFNRLTSLTSFIGERFLFPIRHKLAQKVSEVISEVRNFKYSPRWQKNAGRMIASISIAAASGLLGGSPAKAETLGDGGGPTCTASDDFKQGFKLLADLAPCEVGEPVEPEHFEVATGNSLQRTTTGLMVWRKKGNWTAFTDGGRTWINGPLGLQDRDNNERFEWEEGGQITEQETGLPFPKQIGDLNRDHVVIYNKGTIIGVIDNREDPQNNWQAIVAVAKKYAPNDRFEIFYYDNPDEVPKPPFPQKYDINVRWSGTYPGAQDGKQLRIQTPEGIWQWHTSLPVNMRPEDVNAFSSSRTSNLLRFFIAKDIVSTVWGDDFAAILRQQAGDPYNSGKMNFSLKVVTVPQAGK